MSVRSNLPPTWKSAVAEHGFSDYEIARIAADFRDYWISKAGAGARKANWKATWTKWVRTEADRRARSGRPLPSDRRHYTPRDFDVEFG